MLMKNAKSFFWESEEEEAAVGPYLVEAKHLNILVRVPKQFSDVKNYADSLMAGDTVMVSYEELDKEMRTRIFDYLNGVSYIIGAQVEKITSDIMIYAPANATIDKEEVKKNKSWL
ncbi:MAG: cell division protein SepF [Acidaminococcaceae bacterium]